MSPLRTRPPGSAPATTMASTALGPRGRPVEDGRGNKRSPDAFTKHGTKHGTKHVTNGGGGGETAAARSRAGASGLLEGRCLPWARVRVHGSPIGPAEQRGGHEKVRRRPVAQRSCSASTAVLKRAQSASSVFMLSWATSAIRRRTAACGSGADPSSSIEPTLADGDDSSVIAT